MQHDREHRNTPAQIQSSDTDKGAETVQWRRSVSTMRTLVGARYQREIHM